MSRVFRFLMLSLALVYGGGYTLFAQELRLSVDFATLFDNTEYASLKNTSSGTLFGSRLTPQVGLKWWDTNELVVGADLYQDFGHNKFLSDAKLQLYYACTLPKFQAYAGIFPRSALKGFFSPLFFDPAYCYYNSSISGVLARYTAPHSPSYVEFAMDYTGKRSYDVRESFEILSSGRQSFYVGRGEYLSLGYDFLMGHYAKDYNPETRDGVVDNILLRPYLRYDHYDLAFIGRHSLMLTLTLSYIQSLQRDRIKENVWQRPFGGELFAELRWAGLSVSNRLYMGKGSLLSYYDRYGSALYHGVPLYRSPKGLYDAIVVSYGSTFCNQTVGVKAGITLESDGTGWGTRQWLQVDVALGHNVSLKRNKTVE